MLMMVAFINTRDSAYICNLFVCASLLGLQHSDTFRMDNSLSAPCVSAVKGLSQVQWTADLDMKTKNKKMMKTREAQEGKEGNVTHTTLTTHPPRGHG
jgi:hypothetical protein